MLLQPSVSTLARVFAASCLLLPACGSDHADLLSGGAGSAGAPGGPCTSSGECSGSAPICDQVSRVCVQCLFDTQCTTGRRCVDKKCVQVAACSSSLDCAGAAGTTVCDPSSGTCVECVSFTDCAGTADCLQNRCVPYTQCSSSLDCSAGLVCDPSVSRCVKCVTAADCPDGESCVANACKKIVECQSDNQCTPQGNLCDKDKGYCVDCIGALGCPDAWHCEAGECVIDACEAGAAKCQGNAVVTCAADGAAWQPPLACPSGTVCKSEGSQAGCAATTCTPGAVTCEGDKLVTCSSDGTSIVSSVDCAAQGMKCIGAACSSLACVPGAWFCQGSELRQCDAQGTSWQLVMTCAPGQVCDAGSATCKTLVCAPGQPACQGSVATSCNAEGSGYMPGGTDCAQQGKTCQGGVCAGCASTAPDAVRMVEAFLGQDDYVVLENRGACPAQLDELWLRIDAVDDGSDLDFDLPPRVLNPGERVYVVDSYGAKAGDIAIGSSQNIFFTYDSGSNALLCKGPCYSGQVLDFLSHASGAQPPAPPAGVSFGPGPLTGITKTNESTHAYVRSQFTGAFPSFKAADWTLAPASRPWVNSPNCPPTQPTETACTGEDTCIYGAVSCTCMPIFGWYCY